MGGIAKGGESFKVRQTCRGGRCRHYLWDCEQAPAQTARRHVFVLVTESRIPISISNVLVGWPEMAVLPIDTKQPCGSATRSGYVGDVLLYNWCAVVSGDAEGSLAR